MTTRVWVGGTGSLDDPNEWSPGGAPGPGDVAIIQIGEATVSMQRLDGFELQLQSEASVLDISDVQFGKSFILSVPPGPGGTATLNATGFNANFGTIEVVSPSGPQQFAPPFTINMSDLAPSADCAGAPAVFLNNGTILVDSGQPFAIVAQSPDAVLINNGLMHLDAPFMNANIGVSVLGSGTIETGHPITPEASALLGASIPYIIFGGAVGAGQDLVFDGVAQIYVAKPSQFHALIHDFEPNPSSSYVAAFFQPEIVLQNTQVTSYTVSHDVLSLWDGSNLVAQLRFTDFAYTKANFLVEASGNSTIVEPQGTLTPIGTPPAHAADHVLV